MSLSKITVQKTETTDRRTSAFSNGLSHLCVKKVTNLRIYQRWTIENEFIFWIVAKRWPLNNKRDGRRYLLGIDFVLESNWRFIPQCGCDVGHFSTERWHGTQILSIENRVIVKIVAALFAPRGQSASNVRQAHPKRGCRVQFLVHSP